MSLQIGVIAATYYPFPPAPRLRPGTESEEVPVQLQHKIRREFHVVVPLVNELKHIPIASDLSLGPVLRFRFLVLTNEPFKDCAR